MYLLQLLSLVSVCCHRNPRSFCASYLETLILILFLKLTLNSVSGDRSGLSSRGYSLNALLPTGVYACARAFDIKSCSKSSVWCLTLLLLVYQNSFMCYLCFHLDFTFRSYHRAAAHPLLEGGVEDLLTGAIILYHSPNLIRTFLGREVLCGSQLQ